MGKGELVCFSLETKPVRFKSMNARRHPQLAERIGIKPPAVATAPPLEESEQVPSPKPPPLAPWHYDPQLFRKLPQFLTAETGETEHHAEREEPNKVTLGL